MRLVIYSVMSTERTSEIVLINGIESGLRRAGFHGVRHTAVFLSHSSLILLI
jgi:hypothetical protein